MYLTPRHILLAGAESRIGEKLLDLLLNEPIVEKVTAPTSTPLAVHRRLDNPVSSGNDIFQNLSGTFDIAFCCAVTKIESDNPEETFHIIDSATGTAFTQKARKLGVTHLILLSTEGAYPGSPDISAQSSGLLEQAVQQQKWPRLTIARAAFLDHQDPGFPENITQQLSRFFSGRTKASDSIIIAHALWRLAQENDEPFRIIEADPLCSLGQ